MAKQALTKEEKKAELNRVRDILLATIDYDLTTRSKIITNDFNSDEYYSNLKNEIEEKFQKGRLATLNQWLRDFTEGPEKQRIWSTASILNKQQVIASTFLRFSAKELRKS